MLERQQTLPVPFGINEKGETRLTGAKRKRRLTFRRRRQITALRNALNVIEGYLDWPGDTDRDAKDARARMAHNTAKKALRWPA